MKRLVILGIIISLAILFPSGYGQTGSRDLTSAYCATNWRDDPAFCSEYYNEETSSQLQSEAPESIVQPPTNNELSSNNDDNLSSILIAVIFVGIASIVFKQVWKNHTSSYHRQDGYRKYEQSKNQNNDVDQRIVDKWNFKSNAARQELCHKLGIPQKHAQKTFAKIPDKYKNMLISTLLYEIENDETQRERAERERREQQRREEQKYEEQKREEQKYEEQKREEQKYEEQKREERRRREEQRREEQRREEQREQQRREEERQRSYGNRKSQESHLKKFYDILELKENATAAEIKAKYKELVMFYHPDHFQTRSAKQQERAEMKFKEIDEAYKKLREVGKTY